MEMLEIRNWIQFCFLLVGGILGLVAFFQNMRQRKIENALKMIKWFYDSISPEDITNWKNLFHSASEPSGAKRGFYVTEGLEQSSLSDYFSEGSPDNGALGGMSDCLEVICHEILVGSIDAKFVWFELGQFLKTIHLWIGSIEGRTKNGSLLDESFPSLNKVFRKYNNLFEKWPCRTHAYVE